MNIIVCGAGRVGYSIAKQLSDQSHSITIIDQSSEDIQKINESIDVKGIVGRATFPPAGSMSRNAWEILSNVAPDCFMLINGSEPFSLVK